MSAVTLSLRLAPTKLTNKSSKQKSGEILPQLPNYLSHLQSETLVGEIVQANSLEAQIVAIRKVSSVKLTKPIMQV